MIGFEIGDRVRITEYRSPKGKVIEKMTGLRGTVVNSDVDYVDVRMDDVISGIRTWLFLPEEIEVIDD